MGVITMLGAHGAPGTSTSVAALATSWPDRVLVADADPDGGALLPGWLGTAWVREEISPERGVLSWVTASRHGPVPVDEHAQTVPGGEHVRLLAGVHGPEQTSAFGANGWARLAEALARVDGDVLVDAGRWSQALPWPLVAHADLVLLTLRPALRHVLAARRVVDTLTQQGASQRLGLAVCATTTAVDARELAAGLGVPVEVALPLDSAAAAVFSDAEAPPRHFARRRLVRRAGHAARALRSSLELQQQARAGNDTEQDGWEVLAS